MNTTYFLGANSRHGFYSFYDSFPSAEDCFLHIIKGGPGNGKSGFMRRIGKAAEAKGLDVEYVVCSGDPDSLDGVYIPALKQAWCDGTAPHVTEPRIFAVTADYVNLGRLCRLPIGAADREKIQRLNAGNKALYARAYSYIAAAAGISDAAPVGVLPKWLGGHIKQLLGGAAVQPAAPHIEHCFFSAITCKGWVHLNDSITGLCSTVYAFDSCAPAALALVVKEAQSRGLQRICSPDPIDPTRLSAVLLPELSMAFAAPDWSIPGQQYINLGAFSPDPQYEAATGKAIELLGQAKALHDELEAVYKPYIDFAGLDAFTAEEIERYI
jgi:hypothetical protein